MEITTVEAGFRALRDLISQDVEEFWVLALGPKKTVLNCRMVFRGTVDACLVHPRDIFRFACLENASSILVAHNHPSGDPQPSIEDIRFTRRLIQAASLMEIPVVDHLILIRDGFCSLRRDGWCSFDNSSRETTDQLGHAPFDHTTEQPAGPKTEQTVEQTSEHRVKRATDHTIDQTTVRAKQKMRISQHRAISPKFKTNF